MAAGHEQMVQTLLDQEGRTYAEEAGIRLKDSPQSLYQTLVLALLLSSRISSNVAVATAQELFAAGYTTPDAMAKASWQDRVDALGRGGYRRYDESTSNTLGKGADLLRERWEGDLRRLRKEAEGDPGALRKLVREVPGIGEVGVNIFFREVQGVWTELRPFVDAKAVSGAKRLGLPTGTDDLAKLVEPADLPRLTSALVRVALSKKTAESVQAAA